MRISTLVNIGIAWIAVGCGGSSKSSPDLSMPDLSLGVDAAPDLAPFKVTWDDRTTGLGSGIKSLVVHPTQANTLYVACSTGVFSSTNGGSTWTPSGAAQIPSGAHALALDPTTPANLYAASGTAVFKSIDGGGSWSGAGTGLDASKLLRLYVDPVHSHTLFAADGQVEWSTDSGANFSLSSTGLPGTGVAFVAIDPNDDTKLYAALSAETSPCLYGSTDGGGTWKALHGADNTICLGGSGINDLVAAKNGAIFAASSTLSKSSDSGATWETLRGITVTAVAVDANGRIYLGDLNTMGLELSDDGGATFVEVTGPGAGMLNKNFPVALGIIAPAPSDPTVLYVVSGDKVFHAQF